MDFARVSVATLVLRNGRVWSGYGLPISQAVAIHGNRILATGNDDDIAALTGVCKALIAMDDAEVDAVLDAARAANSLAGDPSAPVGFWGYSQGGGAMPVDSNGASWNRDFVTTTGNVVVDLLHNFHLECGARLHKLRVYETLTDPTGREVCGYLLVRGSVHAHAYALAIKKLTGVEIEKMLPTPNIVLDKIPECQKYLVEGSHRRLYTFSQGDYQAIRGIWEGEQALPGDPLDHHLAWAHGGQVVAVVEED